MLSTSFSWFKERFRLFQHRYYRLLTVFSLVITYVTAVIIVFNLWSGFVIMMYGIILAFIGFMVLIWLVMMFVCSLFSKGRYWFDEKVHYSHSELEPYIIRLDKSEDRLDKLEKRMSRVESTVKNILKEVKKDGRRKL